MGTAVERNRIRRRLREALRRLPGRGRPGFDYVVVARRDLLGADFPTIVADLADAIDGLHRAPGPRGRDRRPDAPASTPQPAERPARDV